MRRPSLLLTIGIAAVLVGGAWLISPAFSRAQAKPGKGQPTGTYLVKFVVGPLSLLGVGSVHTDGTWTMSDQSDFGGVPGLESLQTPWHGIWKVTGPNQTTITGLSFSFGSGGVPTRVNRITGVVDWSPGFKTGNGVTSQRFYALGQDPLDPNGGTPAPPPLNALPISIHKMVE